MDTVTTYRPIIERVLADYAQIPYAHGDIQVQVVFDRQGDHYLLMLVEREGVRRVHGCLVHVDIHEGKIWIQRDGTEHGKEIRKVSVWAANDDWEAVSQ